jgi:LacI family transcriptional regulator
VSVTLKEIGKRAGVSDVAVWLALRNSPRVSAERRKQIQSVAREMGYQPNLAAGALRSRKSYTIGLLTGNFQTGITNLKVEAIEQILVRERYHVLVGFTRGEWERTFEYAHSMLARQVDGLIIADGTDVRQISSKLLPSLKRRSVACVVVDPSSKGYDKRLPCVEVDRHAGMRQAGQHLVELGHRDIVYVFGLHPGVLRKMHGLLEGVGDLPLRGTNILEQGWCDLRARMKSLPREKLDMPLVREESEKAAYAKGTEIAGWRERPTAIAAVSDTIAMALINGLLDHGVRVPEDISVVGFDGAEETRFFRPALTTVRQPAPELAQAACEILLESIRTKTLPNKQRLITPELVVRDSTRPPGDTHP